jgi:hypothetical protein
MPKIEFDVKQFIIPNDRLIEVLLTQKKSYEGTL